MMTTPERLRRRQRIEGTALLILGVFTVLIAFYFNAEDKAQRECMADKFQQFTQVQTIRGDAVEMVISRIAKATTGPQVKDALADFRRSRQTNPIPPFPEGTCE